MILKFHKNSLKKLGGREKMRKVVYWLGYRERKGTGSQVKAKRCFVKP